MGRGQFAIAAAEGIRGRPVTGAPAQTVLAARDTTLIVLAVGGGGRRRGDIGAALGTSGKGRAQQEAKQAEEFIRHIN